MSIAFKAVFKKISSQSNKNILNFIVQSVLGFASFSIFAKTFGYEIYGTYSLIFSFIIFLSVLDYSNNFSLIKYNTSENAYEKLERVKSIIVINLFFILIAIGLFFLLIYLNFHAEHQIGIENTDFINRTFLIICASTIIVRYLNQFLRSFAESEQKFDLNNYSQYIQNITVFIYSLYSIFKENHQVQDLIEIQLISTIFSLIYLGFVLRRMLLPIIATSIKLKRRIFVDVLKYNISLQASFSIGSFLDPLIKVFINRYSGPSMVTSFDIAKKISDAISGVVNSSFRVYTVQIGKAVSDATYDFSTQVLAPSFKQIRLINHVLLGLGSGLIYTAVMFLFSDRNAFIFLNFFIVYHLVNNISIPSYIVFMLKGKGTEIITFQVLNILCVSFLYCLVYFFELKIQFIVLGISVSSLVIFSYCMLNLDRVFLNFKLGDALNGLKIYQFVTPPILIILFNLLYMNKMPNYIVYIPYLLFLLFAIWSLWKEYHYKIKEIRLD